MKLLRSIMSLAAHANTASVHQKRRPAAVVFAVALMAGLLLSSAMLTTKLFAQSPGLVPVGPPGSVSDHPQAAPARDASFVLPKAVHKNGGFPVGQSYDGIDFIGSNCFCLPPDTNAAVGNNYVVEAVNVQIRIFDKTTGAVLLDEPLSTFFGAPSG